jgi:hypothetical protein
VALPMPADAPVIRVTLRDEGEAVGFMVTAHL